jgi:hypothetical protein
MQAAEHGSLRNPISCARWAGPGRKWAQADRGLTTNEASRRPQLPWSGCGRRSASAVWGQACAPDCLCQGTCRRCVETGMVSFSFHSLAMRSSPQVGFSAAIFRISFYRSLGSRSARRPGFPAPKEAESLAVPAEEGIGLGVHQGVTPPEKAPQNHHSQPSGIIGAVWLHLPGVQTIRSRGDHH